MQVAVLTQALTKTMDFEAEMADIFGDTARAIATADGQWTAVGGKDDVHGQLHEAPAPRDAVDEPAATTATAGGTDGPAPWTFKGAISGAFRGYLTLYVSLEDKAIKEGVRDLVAGETWKVAEDLKAGDKATRVLSSSADLFLLIKKALKRCIPVSTGETLHDLHKVWRAALCAYAAAITAKLPKLPPVATGWEPPAVHLSDEELALACTAVTTAEYCSTTSGELEASIQRSIDAAFADQVDMSEAQDAFQAVVTHAVKLLVADVETQLQSHLLAYTRTRWEALEGVAEESSQINSILRALGKVRSRHALRPRPPPPLHGERGAETARHAASLLALGAGQVGEFWGAHLLPIYVRFTCDKLVASFMPRFVAMVLRCRRIGETGAQQLLLDLQALKSALYELPVSCGTTTTSAYTKLVTAEVAKAETLLRLVLTPEEALQVRLCAREELDASLHRAHPPSPPGEKNPPPACRSTLRSFPADAPVRTWPRCWSSRVPRSLKWLPRWAASSKISRAEYPRPPPRPRSRGRKSSRSSSISRNCQPAQAAWPPASM